MQKNDYTKGVLIAIAGAILFSTKAILVKTIYNYTEIDASTMVVMRMLMASPFYMISLWYLCAKKQNKPTESATPLWQYCLLAGLLFYLSAIFDFIGLKYISAGMERLVLFIYPTLVLIFSAIFFGQSIKKYQLRALLLTYSGIALAFIFEVQQQAFHSNLFIGAAWVLLSSVTYAFFLISNGRAVKHFDVALFTNYTMLAATACMVVQFLITNNVTDLLQYQAPVYGLLLVMAFFSTVLPSYLVSYGIKRIGSNDAAIVNSVGPISTIIQAYFILGEHISLAQLIGTALVIGGIWLISQKK